MEEVGVSLIECSWSKGIEPKMRGYELRSGVCWQEVLKQKRHTTRGGGGIA
jgi:hypothetical protein